KALRVTPPAYCRMVGIAPGSIMIAIIAVHIANKAPSDMRAASMSMSIGMASATVFVVSTHPERPLAAFVAAVGHEIQDLGGDVDRLDAAREGRIGPKDLPFRVSIENAQALALRCVGVLQREVVKSLLLLHLLRSKGDVEVEVEVVAERGHPVERPPHPLAVR